MQKLTILTSKIHDDLFLQAMSKDNLSKNSSQSRRIENTLNEDNQIIIKLLSLSSFLSMFPIF